MPVYNIEQNKDAHTKRKKEKSHEHKKFSVE